MPVKCDKCRLVVRCACDPLPVTIVETVCAPDPQGTLWVVVRDEKGSGVGDATIEIKSSAPGMLEYTVAGTTDSKGLFRCDFSKSEILGISVKKLSDPVAKTHLPPRVAKKIVSVSPGSVSHAFFDLRPKAALTVELVRCDNAGDLADITKGATVFVDAITNVVFVREHKELVIGTTKSAEPANGIAKFEEVEAGQYRVRVLLAKEKREQYGTTDLQCEVEVGKETKVKVPVEEIFKKVQFVGLCVAAVAKPIWVRSADPAIDDDGVADDLVAEYEYTRIKTGAPDAGARFETFLEDLQDHWGTSDANERFQRQSGRWLSRYQGLADDDSDIKARIKVLGSAMDQARAALQGDSDSTLKIFMAPECFFLGKYGAFPMKSFEKVVEQLQALVKDPKWKSWIFVFGTVNGFYETEEPSVRNEMFNIAPVIRGGWGCCDGNPEKFTRLQQKSSFSAELPGAPELEKLSDAEKAKLPREQLSEQTFSAGFQTTANEGILGEKLLGILQQVDADADAVAKGLAISEDDAKKMRDEARKVIAASGLAYCVRLVRGGATNTRAAKHPGKWQPWMGRLQKALEKTVATLPAIVMNQAETARRMDYRDYCFSGMRLAGPWLDDVAEPTESDLHRKLTFVLETCADHLGATFAKAVPSVKVDIHLVPSAGAQLTESALTSLVQGGFAFNCDGWNTTQNDLFARKGHVVLVENDLAPRKGGSNPLIPHTELWQVKTEKVVREEENQKKVQHTRDEKAKKEYETNFEQWREEYKQWAAAPQGAEPAPPVPPYPAPPPPPSRFTFVNASVTVVRLADDVSQIFPYETAAPDAAWQRIETQVNERAEREQTDQRHREDAELSAKQSARDKENQLLTKFRNGDPAVKPGGFQALDMSFQALQEAHNIAPVGPMKSAAEKKVKARQEAIDRSTAKIATLVAEIDALTQTIQGRGPRVPIKLRALELAVPELHVYAAQDLPATK